MEDDMICIGAEECKELKDVVHIVYCGDKEVHQRPENCSGQRPHRFNYEECGGNHCVFLGKWVKCIRIWVKNPEYEGDEHGALRNRFKRCGVGVKINALTKFVMPEVIELDDYCRICDFAFILGGKGVKIGKHTDIQPHVVIWGGGELVIGDYVSVAPGTVLLTAVYTHKEGLRMVDGLPPSQAHALYGKLVIENDVYIGANATLMPDITIGEGAVIGAGSFVNRDVEPWSVNVGSPCRKIGERSRLRILR